ncbi:MAG: hypothetical protein ACYC3A_11265 [Halothiobacillus sp.]
MVVLRRLDTLLEPTKEKVLEEVEFQTKEMKSTELDTNCKALPKLAFSATNVGNPFLIPISF